MFAPMAIFLNLFYATLGVGLRQPSDARSMGLSIE
mgnify:CR=1 FL=1